MGPYSGPVSLFNGHGTGVLGESTQDNGRGVHGRLLYDGMGIGVFGEADNSAAYGVLGISVDGTGVHGESHDGTALAGIASTLGTALRTRGNLRFVRVSGVATIAAGKTSVVVTPPFTDVGANSFVLLTPKVNVGGRSLWFTTDTAGNKFTIRMSSTRSSPTPVAYLLANSA